MVDPWFVELVDRLFYRAVLVLQCLTLFLMLVSFAQGVWLGSHGRWVEAVFMLVAAVTLLWASRVQGFMRKRLKPAR